MRELDCIRAITDEALDYARQHEADLYDAEPDGLEHEIAIDVAVSSIEALRNIHAILKREDYVPVNRRAV